MPIWGGDTHKLVKAPTHYTKVATKTYPTKSHVWWNNENVSNKVATKIVACCMCGGRRLAHNRRLMHRLKQQSIASRSSWHIVNNLITGAASVVTRKIVNIFLPVVFDSAVVIML